MPKSKTKERILIILIAIVMDCPMDGKLIMDWTVLMEGMPMETLMGMD